MKLNSWLWLCPLIFIWSCDALDDLNKDHYISRVNEPITGYKEQKDVFYGWSEFQNFDIFYPENAYSKPSEVVILLHGGGWTFGDKWFLDPSVAELRKARKNLTIVNLNYRLVNPDQKRSLYEYQLADVDSCVNYLRQNRARYNIRSDKFAIMGASAGAHLALSYAYSVGKSKIHTVIGMSSITELSDTRLLSADLWWNIKELTGYKESNIRKDSLIKASPVYLANVDSPRTILLYGLRDDVVSIRQQTLLTERLTSLRVPHALYILKDQDHNVEARHVAKGILASLGADEYDRYFKYL